MAAAMRAWVAALCATGVLAAWSEIGRAALKHGAYKEGGSAGQTAKDATSATANSVYNEIAKAPGKARAKRNPYEGKSEAVAAGRILFEQHCADCHGAEGVGGKRAPSLRAPEVQNAPPGAIFWILTNGVVRRGMPVWSKLPEAQRWQLVAYLKSLGVVEQAEK